MSTSNIGSKQWKDGLIPFCGHEESLLVVDTRNDNLVYEWDEDSGLGDDPIANSLASYLEEYRNNLLSGSCEFLGSDCGVIEKVTKSRK